MEKVNSYNGCTIRIGDIIMTRDVTGKEKYLVVTNDHCSEYIEGLKIDDNMILRPVRFYTSHDNYKVGHCDLSEFILETFIKNSIKL